MIKPEKHFSLRMTLQQTVETREKKILPRIKNPKKRWIRNEKKNDSKEIASSSKDKDEIMFYHESYDKNEENDDGVSSFFTGRFRKEKKWQKTRFDTEFAPKFKNSGFFIILGLITFQNVKNINIQTYQGFMIKISSQYGIEYFSSQVIILAMNDMNRAKLTSADLALFIGITSDLFPGVEVVPTDYEEFFNYVRAEALKMKIQASLANNNLLDPITIK